MDGSEEKMWKPSLRISLLPGPHRGSNLILQPLHRFTHVIAHSPTLLLLHLRHLASCPCYKGIYLLLICLVFNIIHTTFQLAISLSVSAQPYLVNVKIVLM